MKIAYLQCPTGIAGDMCLGALVDAGVPLEYLVEQLGRLGIAQEYKLWTEQVHRNGLRATKFHVDLVFASGEIVDPDTFNTFQREGHDADSFHPSQSQVEPELPRPDHHSHPQPQSHSHPHPHPHPHLDPVGSPAHHGHPVHAAAHSHPHHAHPPAIAPLRHLPEIEQLILQAKFPAQAEAWSLAVFRQLAAAEGAVHGIPPEQVHFHEVGATDALVDIIGTCLGLDWLGIDRLVCSPLPVGGGSIWAAHGRLPIPSPAVLKLFELGQVPIYHNGIERELVTPTGAAIATTLADHFGAPPSMTLQQVGLGAGSRELPLPNMLRLWLGETAERQPEKQHAADSRQTGAQASQSSLSPSPAPSLHSSTHLSTAPSSCQSETVLVLETQIDDLNPQAIGYVLERLLEAGALDVFTQAIAMKKSRPGTLLTVICLPEQRSTCEAILFQETTTLGIRCLPQERQALPREIQWVDTEFGQVRVKVAWAAGRDRPPTNVQPEYEDCAHLARTGQVAWREVQRRAMQQWYALQSV
ncbi:MAG: nickel pincer cofactor biosynthesis protein LarC [Leptolyngbyaceae cyanobacterium bins.349]|nr:nickel pincer cofactor biosynthesis protein LarC [Leptolyngbyaceae cyanobacterium bins.349]